MTPDPEALAAALAPSGLILRGGFAFEAQEDAPAGPSGRRATMLVLVGNAGASHWPPFRAWRAGEGGTSENPLDEWTRVSVDPVAARFSARPAYPFEKPYHPFQRWAMRAERLKPSPLGILMHPRYGLWHAYRAALLFEAPPSAAESALGRLRAMNQAPAEPIHLCDLCDGKPCLKSCPAGAYSGTGFAYGSCLAHVRSQAGLACRDGGCLDRNACPYGIDYRYPAEVQAFHMAAFERAGPR